MWGIRVLIPEKLQDKVLKSLHENHPGIMHMKAIVRSYFRRSGLDRNIKSLAKSSLVPRRLRRGRRNAWYTLFAHALISNQSIT